MKLMVNGLLGMEQVRVNIKDWGSRYIHKTNKFAKFKQYKVFITAIVQEMVNI